MNLAICYIISKINKVAITIRWFRGDNLNPPPLLLLALYSLFHQLVFHPLSISLSCRAHFWAALDGGLRNDRYLFLDHLMFVLIQTVTFPW